MKRKIKPDLAAIVLGLLFSVCLPVRLFSQTGGPREQSGSPAQPTAPVTVPDRPAAPLYQGKSGTPQSEVEFVPLTRTVTIEFQVQDPNGYFLPNIRRDNFAVYEDGVRQKNVSVEIEHAPVTVALVMEFGLAGSTNSTKPSRRKFRQLARDYWKCSAATKGRRHQIRRQIDTSGRF